jgi:hypothetical protein
MKRVDGPAGQLSFAALNVQTRLAWASLPIALAWLVAFLVTG